MRRIKIKKTKHFTHLEKHTTLLFISSFGNYNPEYFSKTMPFNSSRIY